MEEEICVGNSCKRIKKSNNNEAKQNKKEN